MLTEIVPKHGLGWQQPEVRKFTTRGRRMGSFGLSSPRREGEQQAPEVLRSLHSLGGCWGVIPIKRLSIDSRPTFGAVRRVTKNKKEALAVVVKYTTEGRVWHYKELGLMAFAILAQALVVAYASSLDLIFFRMGEGGGGRKRMP